MNAQVTKIGLIDMQVCVPKNWTDEQVVEFAEKENPSGTKHGWQIRREGSFLLRGDPERNPCSANSENVHITLDA